MLKQCTVMVWPVMNRPCKEHSPQVATVLCSPCCMLQPFVAIANFEQSVLTAHALSRTEAQVRSPSTGLTTHVWKYMYTKWHYSNLLYFRKLN